MKIQKNLAEFERRGARVAAVSGDHLASLRKMRDRDEFGYPILHAADASAFRAFDALKTESDIFRGLALPYPTGLLIDPAGRLVWQKTRQSLIFRVTPRHMLDAFDEKCPAPLRSRNERSGTRSRPT